jgi:hypothetical protein
MVYTTVARNERITLDQIHFLLGKKFLLTTTEVNGAVASLLATWLAAPLSKFERGTTTYLNVKRTVPPVFESWLNSLVEAHPELSIFEPPVVKREP